MKRYLIAVAISGFACNAPPVAVHSTDNAAITVEQLFTYDGCTVYRFNSDGSHYFARCGRGGSVTTTRSQVCGKGCVHRVEDVIALGKP